MAIDADTLLDSIRSRYQAINAESGNPPADVALALADLIERLDCALCGGLPLPADWCHGQSTTLPGPR